MGYRASSCFFSMYYSSCSSPQGAVFEAVILYSSFAQGDVSNLPALTSSYPSLDLGVKLDVQRALMLQTRPLPSNNLLCVIS